MENIIFYIENVTREKNLSSKSWQEIVDKVILPKMAGPKGSRWCINDMFLNLMAEYAVEISCKDQTLAPILFEIGLQRLSCGAVLHDPTPWPEPLPKKYWDYSSKWDEGHVMTEGCINFLLKASEQCLQFDMTKDHALKILFGLMENTYQDGIFKSSHLLGQYQNMADRLFQTAEKVVEQYASFEEIYPYYTRPGQWEKHILYLSKHQKKINWKDFFKRTKALEKVNIFNRWIEKKTIRKRIEYASMWKTC